MSDLDAAAFIEWLYEDDSYYVRADRVREEFPEFYDEHELVGITVTEDEDGNVLVPKRDYRHALVYGQPLD